jgi:hypothetical protein
VEDPRKGKKKKKFKYEQGVGENIVRKVGNPGGRTRGRKS